MGKRDFDGKEDFRRERGFVGKENFQKKEDFRGERPLSGAGDFFRPVLQ